MNPDLIIVGPHGHNALRRLGLGSVAQRVLAEAHGSVRIARHQSSVDGSPVRIIIGVDGSADSCAAAREVASRTWPARSAVRVIATLPPAAEALVSPLVSPVAMPNHTAISQQREMLEIAAEATAELVRATGMPVTAEVIEGRPTSVLLDNAREWGADIIFFGSHMHSFTDRDLPGDVPAAVAAQAECSVEIVRMR
jgi:nucleotide-binding universal stress UspA family protein